MGRRPGPAHGQPSTGGSRSAGRQWRIAKQSQIDLGVEGDTDDEKAQSLVGAVLAAGLAEKLCGARVTLAAVNVDAG